MRRRRPEKGVDLLACSGVGVDGCCHGWGSAQTAWDGGPTANEITNGEGRLLIIPWGWSARPLLSSLGVYPASSLMAEGAFLAQGRKGINVVFGCQPSTWKGGSARALDLEHHG